MFVKSDDVNLDEMRAREQEFTAREQEFRAREQLFAPSSKV